MKWTFEQHLIFWINILCFWTLVIPMFTLIYLFSERVGNYPERILELKELKQKEVKEE